MLRTPYQVVLLCGTFLVPITSAARCTGVSGLIASLVINVPEAQSFCSSRYPQATVTSSLAAPTVQATSTIQTTATAAALTVTTTAPEVTTTITVSKSTITETTTTTVIGAAKAKREAQAVDGTTAQAQSASSVASNPPSPSTTSSATPLAGSLPANCGKDPRACAIQSLKSALPALASSVCNCIQTPKTTTVTPPASTATILTTEVVTETPASVVSTITPTATLSATFTTTTTVTSTVTQAAGGLPRCDWNSRRGCSANCVCDPVYGGVNANVGYCFTSGSELFGSCGSNADCPANSFCDTDFSRCLSNAGCTSTFVPPAKNKRTEEKGSTAGLDKGVKNKEIGGMRIVVG